MFTELPAVPGGETTVISLSLALIIVASKPPKLTVASPLKPCPLIIIIVPPDAGPKFMLILLTVGANPKTMVLAVDEEESKPLAVLVDEED